MNIKQFTSRKFLLSFFTIVVAITGALSGIGGNVGTVSCIIGAIASCLVYTITEGVIDAKSVIATTKEVKELVEELNKDK